MPELCGSPHTASLRRRGRAAAKGALHLPQELNRSLQGEVAHGLVGGTGQPSCSSRSESAGHGGSPSRQLHQPQHAQPGAETPLSHERERAQLGPVRAMGAVPSRELAHAHPLPGAKRRRVGGPVLLREHCQRMGPSLAELPLAQRC